MQLDLVVQSVANQAFGLLQIPLCLAVPRCLQDNDAPAMLVRPLQEALLSCQLILHFILHIAKHRYHFSRMRRVLE